MPTPECPLCLWPAAPRCGGLWRNETCSLVFNVLVLTRTPVKKSAKNRSDVPSTTKRETSRPASREVSEMAPCVLHESRGGANPSLSTRDESHV
jgi:hypothetical protein